MSQSELRPGAAAGGECMPLLTAIVVTRNKESHIRECLTGLMEQSVAGNMEVVVVDQGSEQSESAIIADLQRRHKNLISLRSPAPGAFAGVNLAVRIASGRYLTILEAADRMKEDAYQTLAQALEEDSEAMVAYGDTSFTAIPHQSFANHTSYGKMIWPDYTHEQLAQLSEVAPHPMWRRELHDSIGGIGENDGALREFMLRAAERFRFVHVPAFTGLKLIHNEAAAHAHPSPPARPAAAAPAAPLPAAPVAEPAADEAYAAIAAVVKGENHLQAAKAVERHLERYPDHAVAHNDMGALYYSLGLSDKALRHYRRAVELSPEENTYQKNLADLLYVEEGQIDEAISIYLELHRRSPRDLETLLNLGIISEGVGQPAEAESFYQRALEVEPWNQTVRERLTELRNRQPEGASVPEDEEPAEDLYEKARALAAQGNADAAIAELEKIVAVYPDFPAAHNDLAVLYHERGQTEEALAHYEKAAALVPGNSTFQKNLADFYFVERRNVDGAIEIYLDQLKKEPRNIDTLMNLGNICIMLDRPEEAETFYGKVTQLEPWNQAARESLTTLRRCVNG